MKKISFAFAIMLILCNPVVSSAYTIGGAYATLVSCNWGQFGYQHGYLGTYNVNGQLYTVFFGNNYCQY